MSSSQLHERKTTTSTFEHHSDAWLSRISEDKARAAEPLRNMTFIDPFIEPPEPPDPMGRELNGQTCSYGQHTLIDTYGAYPLRTPWLAAFTHTAYDPFELLDGDTSLLVCLMQAQLAADRENSTTQSFVSTAAHSESRRSSSESRRIDRTHQLLCPSQHSSASIQNRSNRQLGVHSSSGRK